MESNKYVNNKDHFLFLDFLRGFAAFNVLLLHWFGGHGEVLFGSSVLAVDFFFMLSGFVIAKSYGERLARGYELSKFLLFRLIRLYPLLAIGVLLGALRVALANVVSDGFSVAAFPFGEFLSTLFLIPQQLSASGVVDFYPINGPLWSLLFEGLAYAAFGLLLYRLNKAGLVLLVVLWFLPFYSWAVHKFGGTPDWWLVNGEQPYGLIFGLARVGVGFSIGVLIERNLQTLRRIVSVKTLAATLPIFSVLLIFPGNLLPAWLVALSVLLLFPLLIIAGTKVNSDSKFRHIYKFSGDVSYPLYVIHVPIIWTLNGLIKAAGIVEDSQLVWFGLVILPVTILISKLSFDFYDRPIRSWLSSKAARLFTKRTKIEIENLS